MLNALMFNKFVIRFSLFWYCGRVFSAMTVSAVLFFLLSETTKVYWRLAHSHAMLERERNNRLMSLEAAAASISHEMKQPLTAITAKGAAAMHLLGLVPPDLDEARAALSDVIDDGHRASQVLDNLRVLFGKANRERGSVDLSAAALGALRALKGELTDHGIAASTELASELPPVVGHRGQLQEVITNLLHNAMEAMTTVQPDRRMLKVRTKPDGGNAIVVEVQDSGPGIDPKHLDRIFDAFVTTKPHGTGLGLAICRMIIERHGGQLSAASDGKNGAIFQIVLPAEPKARKTQPARHPAD
jgi:signal transduction histidine kinase